MRKWITFVSLLVLTSALLTACGSSNSNKPLTKVSQIVGWTPQPESGGQYAALMKGFYQEAGLDMTIEPGGPQITPSQLVASGKIPFGMAKGDDLLLARQEGLPLVAIAGIFQKTPQALMFHKGEPIKDFKDLNGRKVYTSPGVVYWEYIKKAYKLDKVEDLVYNGQLATFSADKTSVSQVFGTNEPFYVKQQGVDIDLLWVADSGYSPYDNILITTEQYIKDHPDIVKAYVEASIKGWNYYKDNYEEVNPFIKEKNKELNTEAMAYASKTMKDLVYGGDAATKGVGYMSTERWEALMKQMIDLKTLKQEQDLSKVFTTKYLPAPK
ncbi:ABC transporter substrate-binding protein [Paenibacillus sp. SI8]|uniref:ABC transporter substrate-binding protein n=1 Tax=unclassified Paenibacillus TaxID=185978 RepID=UPI003466714D